MRHLVILLALAAAAFAQPSAIDAAKSKITVRVFKSGVLSALGHDHEISAPIASGTVDTNAHRAELRVNADALRVIDAKGSEKDRAEIQKTMLGPEVLDTARHHEIAFRSTSAEPAGAETWTVHGNLTLHGETQLITVTVKHAAGHYTGTAMLKQTRFGMKPVRVAGGTVKVKDEVRIEFDIQIARHSTDGGAQ